MQNRKRRARRNRNRHYPRSMTRRARMLERWWRRFVKAFRGDLQAQRSIGYNYEPTVDLSESEIQEMTAKIMQRIKGEDK